MARSHFCGNMILIQRAQIGKARLDRLVAPPQRVVFGVGDGRRVLLVVGFVVCLDFGFEAGVLAPGLAGRHVIDGELRIPRRSGHGFHILPTAGSGYVGLLD